MKIKNFFDSMNVGKAILVVSIPVAILVALSFGLNTINPRAYLGVLGGTLILGGAFGAYKMGKKTKQSYNAQYSWQRQDKDTNLFLTIFLGAVSILGVYVFILMFIDK